MIRSAAILASPRPPMASEWSGQVELHADLVMRVGTAGRHEAGEERREIGAGGR